MRLFTTVFLFGLATLFAQTTDEKDAVAAVQKLFDSMAARDGAMIRSTMLPDARVYSVRDQAAPAVRTGEDMAVQIAASPDGLLERFTKKPAVSIRGRMAQVWGEYEFLRAGKFTHCGVDSVSLFKTGDGWKIAAITYTVETTGCAGH